METIKEIQKRELLKDIDEQIDRMQEKESEAASRVDSRFLSGLEFDDAISDMTNAMVKRVRLERIRLNARGLDLKMAILYVRWHAHQIAKSEDVEDVTYKELAEILDGIAERADERRKCEIVSADGAVA